MYTWNKDWICQGESPWGIINKFLYANEIHSVTAARELTTGKGRVIETYRANHIYTGIVSNYELAANNWLTRESSIEEYGNKLLKQHLDPLIIIQNKYNNIHSVSSHIIRKNLYYCPDCMKYGQHLMHHQFTFIHKCMVHNVELNHTCPVCSADMPYTIEFCNEIKHYGCKQCGNQLFHNDNFGEAVNNWFNKSTLNIPYKSNYSKAIPLILSNNIKHNLYDVEINKYLESIYTNGKDSVVPKYIIYKGFQWDNMYFGNIITPNLDEKRKIEEYVYVYSYLKLYRHLSRTLHIRHKLHKAEEYMRNCVPMHKILTQMQIDHYCQDLDLNAVTLYLWKRDMEYSGFSKNVYYMNKTTAYNYSFDPDDEIIEYVKRINEILPGQIESSYRFNILVHIVITLMNDKFNMWQNYMKSLIQLYENKLDITKHLDNITLRSYSKQYNKEFLVTINPKDNIYKIYFSANIDNQ